MRVLLPAAVVLMLSLGTQAFAATQAPVIVSCGPNRHAVVRNAFVKGEPVTRVECVGPPYGRVNGVSRYRAERPHRSWAKSALIIGGSAGTGAGIGALVNGKKGALIGAALGGGAASIYEGARRR
jgi:hypothetical protein